MEQNATGAIFQISDYYELRALYRAVILAKFLPNSPVPELAGSPFLAEVANRIVEVLGQMEIERGKPNDAETWRQTIVPNSPRWQVLLDSIEPSTSAWQKWSLAEKSQYVSILMSPFKVDNDLVALLIQQADDLYLKSE